MFNQQHTGVVVVSGALITCFKEAEACLLPVPCRIVVAGAEAIGESCRLAAETGGNGELLEKTAVASAVIAVVVADDEHVERIDTARCEEGPHNGIGRVESSGVKRAQIIHKRAFLAFDHNCKPLSHIENSHPQRLARYRPPEQRDHWQACRAH